MVAPSILRPREIDPLRMAKLVAHEIQVALVAVVGDFKGKKGDKKSAGCTFGEDL